VWTGGMIKQTKSSSKAERKKCAKPCGTRW
jgi:hypothetical protein